MDPPASTGNDVEDSKYHPPILENTLHKHLSGIVDIIEPEKKHAFFNILYDSLNSVLSCFQCKLPLKENSASFNCGHKYCEQCAKNLEKCTSCYDGKIRCNIRDFSNILNVINEIKSNFNSDKVIYEMMRYLLMPQKFPYTEETVEMADTVVECTPSDTSVAETVAQRKSRKSTNSRKSNVAARTPNSSRKKLEFNKESNEKKNSTNLSTLGNSSDSLFLETAKNKQKTNEKKRSYLELQPTISELNNESSPGSNTRSKRKSNESYLELQATISDMNGTTTPASNTQLKRKISDSGSVDRITRKSKRIKTKNDSGDSLVVEDKKPEPINVRKKSTRQTMESPQRSSDSSNQGTISGFENRQLLESFNKLELVLNCYDAERRAYQLERSEKLSVNVDVLSATGEVKQQNVTEKKVNPMLNSIKNAVDVVKNSFTPKRDIDAEVLDLDVWKRNDRYEKKKNLFKSVKERNKRSISIGGSLGNLLEHRKPSPKKQSPLKSNNKVEQIGMKKNSETSVSKDDKNSEKESTSSYLTKEEILKKRDVSEEPSSKTTNESEPKRNEPTVTVLLQKISPRKKSPVEADCSLVESKENIKDFQIRLPNVEANLIKKCNSIPSSEEKISKTVEIFKSSVSAPEIEKPNDRTEKESAETIQEIESAKIKDSGVLDKIKGKAIAEEIIPANEPPTMPRKILAEISDHKQNTLDFENPIENPEIGVSSVESKTPARKCGKLGLPLFPETNGDIFSQKGDLRSSTPCVVAIKKITKTYSKAKNNLFNRSIPYLNPVEEEKHCFDEFAFPDISPIVEKKRLNDEFHIAEDLFDEITGTPRRTKKFSKPSPTKDPFETVAPNTHIVVAEVHEAPATPPIRLPIETPKPITPEEHNSPFTSTSTKTIQLNDSQLDKTMPMEIDSVMETVEKVAEKVLTKKMESTIDLEDEIQPVDSDVERKIKLEKVKKLQESINNKTEKTLSNLKKNFNKNTSKLSVEKIKTCTSSTTPAKSNCHFIPIKSSPPKDHDENELSVISAPKSKELSNDYGDIPTQKRCSPTKSVACQTTPDLHLALLKQEFPHIFEKFSNDSAKKDFPLSVYDTPTEMINEGVKITAKTPDVPLLNTTAKFTAVSSITSSEKKLADEQFMNDSVLGNSSLVISANKTVNISGYAPLTPRTLDGKRRLSCRLNFDQNADEDVEERTLNVPLEISANLDGDVTIKNASDFSVDRSNEIDFSEGEPEVENDEEVVVSASILEDSTAPMLPIVENQSKPQEDTDKTFFESDKPATPVPSASKKTKEDKDSTLTVIPDTDNFIPGMDDKNEVVTDEDDDVDFIAGTPTSQPRRALVDTLEKIRTPMNLLKKPLDISLSEFSIVGNTTPDLNTVQRIDTSLYSAVKKPIPAEITPKSEPAKVQDTDKVSLELFNSSASFLSSVSEKIFIATSGLKEHEAKIIKKFCEVFSATYEDKLSEKTTHLVVKINHKNRTARTFKYLQAIVSRVRIVSMKWIQECLKKEKIVDEENYVPLDSSGEFGPLRTFNVIKGTTPSPLSWLNEYCIYFTEPVPQECTLQQLQSIMQKAGAVVVNSMREFKNYPKHHHIIIVSDDDDYDDDYNMKIAGWLESYGAVSIEFNWILEVIGRNRLMPFADFEVIEIPNDYLLQRNFPPVMLQSNEEDGNSSD